MNFFARCYGWRVGATSENLLKIGVFEGTRQFGKKIQVQGVTPFPQPFSCRRTFLSQFTRWTDRQTDGRLLRDYWQKNCFCRFSTLCFPTNAQVGSFVLSTAAYRSCHPATVAQSYSTRDSKPGRFFPNPGFGFGRPQTRVSGSGFATLKSRRQADDV